MPARRGAVTIAPRMRLAMMDSDDEERKRVGLCANCRFVRRVESGRGSTFFLCRKSSVDPSFPKYPRLPVIECRGYDRRESQ